MEKFFTQSALLCVLFLASSTVGGCFPLMEEEVQKNWQTLMAPILDVNLSSSGHESNQAGTLYLAVYGSGPSDNAITYYGVEATMDVYGFNLEHGQQTGGFISIYNKDEASAINNVIAGWNIEPESYNDSQTHFSTWFTQGSNACPDMRCPGFESVFSSEIVPGMVINPVSTTSSDKQYITVRVSKDPNSGDWQVYYGFNGEARLTGYYPRSLFTSLSYKPVTIMFGGYAFKKEHKLPSPPMGSGNAPIKNAASFSSVKAATAIKSILLSDIYQIATVSLILNMMVSFMGDLAIFASCL
uniref:Neprosin PEP catalytic domain-containing protein n=1 Tax=Oryza glumipatula TaxID=40148 RepID=A0A0E0BT35_9ORYZ